MGNDDYSNWKKKEKSKWSKISKQIQPVFVFILAVIILGGNYLVASKQISAGVFGIFVVSFVLLFLFLVLRENPEPSLLPEDIIKQIAREKAEQKRKEGMEFPYDCLVKIHPIVGSVYETDFITGTSGIIKREVGLEIITNGLGKKYIMSIHPYNGTVLDIIPKPLGLTKDALGKDRVIILHNF